MGKKLESDVNTVSLWRFEESGSSGDLTFATGINGEIRVDQNGNVTYATDCITPTATPTPSPTPSAVQIYRGNSSHGNVTNACADTGLNVVYSTADVPQLQANDYIYTNSSLSTPFNGGGQYWSLEEGGGTAPFVRKAALIASDGRIQLLTNCP